MGATVILSAIGGAGSQFFDNNGAILNGGKLYTYEAGTTTPAATYTDSTGTTAQANPVVLDSAGRVSGDGIWLVYGTQYKFALKDSADNTIATWDNFPGSAEYDAITSNQTQINTINSTISSLGNCFVLVGNTSSSPTINGGATELVPYDAVITDVGSNFTLSSKTFTAPAAGNYIVSVAATFTPLSAPAAADAISFSLYKNGSESQLFGGLTIETTSTAERLVSATTSIRLAAGDTMTVYVTVNSSANWTYGADASQLAITRAG